MGIFPLIDLYLKLQYCSYASFSLLLILLVCSKEVPPSEARRLSIGSLGVGGLSLSAVTASVGKQIGALSEVSSQHIR